jgi:DNA end-binding protein Ku
MAPPRAIWTGSITFGLVNAPVRMYAAISEKTLKFNMLQEKDGGRIGYQRVCKIEDEPVPNEEIVKAYEVSKDEFVILEPEDFASAEVEGYRAITILDFVPLDEIDPIYFERTYYLGPQEGPAEKVYALLARAMENAGLAAIASYIFHDRQNLGCLRVRDGVITLEKMYFSDEVREATGIAPENAAVSDRELDMAAELIDRFSGHFEPEKYEDSYRQKLLAIIEQKAAGKAVKRPPSKAPSASTDLLEALAASLRDVKASGGGRKASKNGDSDEPKGASSRRGRASKAMRDRDGADDLSGLSLDELQAQAKEANIRGRSKMSKKELVEALSGG